jgi:exonuclease SbcC
MQILSVTLTNFKAHRDREFRFQLGTNAICGENGAGKTSVVEAIAWVLFNYRGSYRTEDLIRNGNGSAQVIIEFISSQDERTYQVERCTTKGYKIIDPQLGTNLNYRHIEDEIMPWMREQLGVSPGTDLGQLFANTVGVPQGTFTADFLQPATQRKRIFDTILKVEEFRKTYKETSSLEKYAKAQVEQVKQAIAQYDDSLQDFDDLKQRQKELETTIATDQATLAKLNTALAELEQQKAAIAEQAQQLKTLEQQRQTLQTQRTAKQQANQLLEQSVQQATVAAQRCEANRASYETIQAIERSLQALEQQRKQQQQLLQKRDEQQRQLTQGQKDSAKLAAQLEQLEQSAAECDRLHPLIAQQTELEQHIASLDEQIRQLSARAVEQTSLTQHLARLRSQWKPLTQDIDRLQQLSESLTAIPDLEARRDRLQAQLSRIEAATQFEAELRQLVDQTQQQRDRHALNLDQALTVLRDLRDSMPLARESVTEAIATIEAEMGLTSTVLTSLKQILADLTEQVSVSSLHAQLTEVNRSLAQTYRQQAEVVTLPQKKAQLDNLKTEGEQTRSQLDSLEAELAQREPLTEQRSHLAAQVAALDNPRARHQWLTQSLQQRDPLQQRYAQIQTAQTELETAIAQLDQQLAEFAQLSATIEQQQQQRQQHQAGYLVYLQSRNDAEQLPTRQTELNQAIAALTELDEAIATVEQQQQTLSKTYDAAAGQQLQADYDATRRQVDRLMGSLPPQQQRLTELSERVKQLTELAKKRDRAKADLKTKEKIKRFVTFARKVYKEAGPRITERYVQNVSREADRLFRELLNRPNVALEWTREYDIVVQEGANARRFTNLSGGEQMCAALAVRLALLRVLADIDVAFFDEPTTNMDRPRRRQLAEAIANLKSFKQLFVISHDDTFEQVTENVIFIERED